MLGCIWILVEVLGRGLICFYGLYCFFFYLGLFLSFCLNFFEFRISLELNYD